MWEFVKEHWLLFLIGGLAFWSTVIIMLLAFLAGRDKED
jgi:hypothetical protein